MLPTDIGGYMLQLLTAYWVPYILGGILERTQKDIQVTLVFAKSLLGPQCYLSISAVLEYLRCMHTLFEIFVVCQALQIRSDFEDPDSSLRSRSDLRSECRKYM